MTNTLHPIHSTLRSIACHSAGTHGQWVTCRTESTSSVVLPTARGFRQLQVTLVHRTHVTYMCVLHIRKQLERWCAQKSDLYDILVSVRLGRQPNHDEVWDNLWQNARFVHS